MPHGEPFLMARRILFCDDDNKSSVVECRIDDPGRMFADGDGVILPEAFLEAIAQSAAAQQGYNQKRKGTCVQEEKAFLVGVRGFEITGEARIGDTLEVSLECVAEIEPLSSLRGVVCSRGEQVAAADISVWHGPASPDKDN